MNKNVKIATLVAFTVVLSLFDVKPAAALDLGKTIGGAINKAANNTANSAASSALNSAVKAANKVAEPKGPMKEINITGVPSEYEGYIALTMAALVENPMNACMPAYLTLGYIDTFLPDSVTTGEVKIHTPCDDKKRLITLVLSKTKDEKNTSSGGWVYVKGTGGDVCKTKDKMPTYKLSETQVFRFSDFIKNEDCKAIADAETKKSKK